MKGFFDTDDGIERMAYRPNKNIKAVLSEAEKLFESLELIEGHEKIEVINQIKILLHKHSLFFDEPVDCIIWTPIDKVMANDYNPNTVAPPEMKLLEHSIAEDGYTQPIVTWSNNGHFEVVDGFHRNRVGRESETVKQRIKGYLPITVINSDRIGRSDRIASTIRHNRARGKHQVEKMSDIVLELKKRNWSEDRIGRELGMEPDEVLRLCQINGLIEMFGNEDFSKAWDAGIFDEENNEGDLLSEES